MRRFLCVLCGSISVGVVFPPAAVLPGLNAQPPAYNPHHGLTHLFQTGRDHKGGTRYPIPQPIFEATRAINWTNTTAEDLSRATVTRAIPTLVNAREPNKLESWRLLEDMWWRHEPLPGGDQRWVWNFNAHDVRQWRLFEPAVKDASGKTVKEETYHILLDHFARDHTDLLPKPSAVNYVSFGGVLKVDGSLRIHLGPGVVVHTLEPKIAVGPGYVVERAGVKYLKIEHNGKNYGVKLDPLD